MNASYGRERTFSESISILQCKCNIQFPFRCQCKQSCINEQFPYVFFKTSILLKLWFSMFSQKAKKNLKENMHFTFQEELWIMRKENQIIKTQTNNPIQYFQWKQKQKQTKELLNVNEKCVLSNQQVQEKHQTLNSQSIPGSQPVRYTQLQKSERMKIPTRSKKWKSSYKGKKNLENLDSSHSAYIF